MMKRILLLTTLAGLLFSGCTGFDCCMPTVLKINVTQLEFDAAGNLIGTPYISCPTSFEPTAWSEWLIVDAAFVDLMTSLSAQPNSDPEPREGTITFMAANGDKLTVKAVQEGYIAPPPTYAINFTTNNVTANNVTATGSISPASPQEATTPITVTVTLTGTATAAGTHTVGLTSATLGAGINDPGTVTKSVTAGALMGDTYDFTFTMPAGAVSDLVVTHTFIVSPG